jgi:hypothetical protein
MPYKKRTIGSGSGSCTLLWFLSLFYGFSVAFGAMVFRPSGNYVEIKERFSGILSARLVAKPGLVFERCCATFARRKMFFLFSLSLLARKSNQNAFVLLYEVSFRRGRGSRKEPQLVKP